MRFFVLALAVFGVCAGASEISVVHMSLGQKIQAPRWLYNSPNQKFKGPRLITLMMQAKQALNQQNRAACLADLQHAYPLAHSLWPWLAWNELECAQLEDKKGHLSRSALIHATARLEAHPDWLLYDPAMSDLKTSYVSALLSLVQLQVKGDRRAAWRTLDKLKKIRGWLDNDEKAQVDRAAGELAFIEQNLSAAQEFLERSLSEKDSAELRARLDSIRTTLLGKKAAPEQPATSTPAPSPDLGISDEEKDIYDRMNRAFESQDYVSCIEDGIELIQKFPGSSRAHDADGKILDIYLSLSTHTEDSFKHVRETVVSDMEKADGGRLANWARSAYSRGNYSDALTLAEKAYGKLSGTASRPVLLLAGDAALAAGDYDTAAAHFQELIKKYGGTKEAAEATFRFGLLEYRQKKYSDAAGEFERLLALADAGNFEYRARYWQWRAQQQVDPKNAPTYAQALVKKFPLTYYGLRAQAELNGGTIQLPAKAVKLKAEFHLLPSERLAWERTLLLLRAGWFHEAQAELDFLPSAHAPEEYLIRAKLWAAALRYDLAIQNMNLAFTQRPDLMLPSVLKIVFPHEYEPWVSKASKKTGLDENWIRSVMRQESAFRPDAESSSDAMGVMQLLPPTGEELARQYKVKSDGTPDFLYDPKINIQLGSAYLARLVNNFNGNIPLALAAYNAGPARLRRWLDARKDLSPLSTTKSSSPEVEVWIDELPWEETSFYVKAILRNEIIYRLLAATKVTLSDPIWVDGKLSSR